MTNSFKEHLDSFFEKLLYYRHMSGRIDKVFQKEIEKYNSDGAVIGFASALIISDWTGSTDNGWEKNFYTGIVTETTKDNYECSIKELFSRQLCLLYAQSFEAFERFIKDCLFNRIDRDEVLREYTISLLPKINRHYSVVQKCLEVIISLKYSKKQEANLLKAQHLEII